MSDPYRQLAPGRDWWEDPTEAETALFDALLLEYVNSTHRSWAEKVSDAAYAVQLRRKTVGRR